MSFTDILNLSIRASWLVAAILVIRLVLKGAPRAFHCALWALVAIRLLCPVTIQSSLSLLPSQELLPEQYLVLEPKDPEFQEPARLEIITNPLYNAPLEIEVDTTVERIQHWDILALIFWMTGVGAMGIYALYSYLSLRIRLRMAGWISGNIWECDEISSPFILGLIRPRIYLPTGLDDAARAHVLAHERAHLRRLDHLWKPFGFLLLTIHWFNPVMWLAYILLCRDIELACDERVIRDLEKQEVRAYSEALIRCSVGHGSIAACPLAFGEIGVKTRIRAMLRRRKPTLWILSAAAMAGMILAVCFLTDPISPSIDLEQILREDGCQITALEERILELEIHKADLPETVCNGKPHHFDDAPILLVPYEDTALYLTCARMSGDELLLTIKLEHTLSGQGTVLLPRHPFDDGASKHVRISHHDVTDANQVYPDAVRLREIGSDFFSIAVKQSVWNKADTCIRLQIEGLYHLAFTFSPPPLSVMDTVRSYAPTNLAGFLLPNFRLNTNGTFVFTENGFSSYMGFGSWVLEDGVLTLATDDGRFVWSFDQDGTDFLFNAARSSPVTYYFDAKTTRRLSNGVRFTQQTLQQVATGTLTDAVAAAGRDLYRGLDDPSHFRTTAVRILDFETASGTPLLGSVNHEQRLTVHTLILGRTYDTSGAEISVCDQQLIHASMEFGFTGDELTLREIKTANYGDDLTGIYSHKALALWQEQETDLVKSLEFDCDADAAGYRSEQNS